MPLKLLLPIFGFLFCNCLVIGQNEMSNEKMDTIFKKEAHDLEGQLGYWTMTYGERSLLVITNKKANRMRIFTPVIEEDKLERGQMKKMLEANFHSALDAKYCLYEGYVISVFTHPLKELKDAQLIDAMRQVVILANTFGSTYSSTEFVFGGGFQKEGPKINQSPTGGKKN